MKYNMNEWLADQLNSPVKKPLPVLSFPGTQLIGKNVEELVNDGHLQALCMKAIAAARAYSPQGKSCPTAAPRES